MKALIVGSGGREHALGWKIGQEAGWEEVFFLPGNGGTSDVGENVAIGTEDFDGIAEFARKTRPDLIVIGPEDPLAAGAVDRLSDRGFTVFGPTAGCARLESSKAFAKQLMSKYSIPTAPYRVFTDASEAHRYIGQSKTPMVVKADGLAQGKGTIVAKDSQEAHRAVEMVMEERVFGAAGDISIIEECLIGEEASVLAISDGSNYVILPPSQDHKQVYDGDRGPNTGGMGAYCPAPVVDSATLDEIEETVIKRLLEGLAREGCRYRGVIYAGLMLSGEGVSVIEFNVRFGDPEIQSMLPVVDVDLGRLLLDAAEGRIAGSRRLASERWAVCVTIASGGYPRAYEKGKEITGLKQATSKEGVVIFHAGTRRLEDGRLVTSGGRVVGVTGTGGTLKQARRRAYQACDMIRFDGMHMRRDIAVKGLTRLEKTGVS
jgi:phosphoribosylamine--glycine ligase